MLSDKKAKEMVEAANAAAKKKKKKEEESAFDLSKLEGWLGKSKTSGQQATGKADGGVVDEEKKKIARMKALQALGNA